MPLKLTVVVMCACLRKNEMKCLCDYVQAGEKCVVDKVQLTCESWGVHSSVTCVMCCWLG